MVEQHVLVSCCLASFSFSYIHSSVMSFIELLVFLRLWQGVARAIRPPHCKISMDMMFSSPVRVATLCCALLMLGGPELKKTALKSIAAILCLILLNLVESKLAEG